MVPPIDNDKSKRLSDQIKKSTAGGSDVARAGSVITDLNNKVVEQNVLSAPEKLYITKKASSDKTVDSKESLSLKEKMKALLPPGVSPEQALDLIAVITGKNKSGYG